MGQPLVVDRMGQPGASLVVPLGVPLGRKGQRLGRKALQGRMGLVERSRQLVAAVVEEQEGRHLIRNRLLPHLEQLVRGELVGLELLAFLGLVEPELAFLGVVELGLVLVLVGLQLLAFLGWLGQRLVQLVRHLGQRRLGQRHQVLVVQRRREDLGSWMPSCP